MPRPAASSGEYHHHAKKMHDKDSMKDAARNAKALEGVENPDGCQENLRRILWTDLLRNCKELLNQAKKPTLFRLPQLGRRKRRRLPVCWAGDLTKDSTGKTDEVVKRTWIPPTAAIVRGRHWRLAQEVFAYNGVGMQAIWYIRAQPSGMYHHPPRMVDDHAEDVADSLETQWSYCAKMGWTRLRLYRDP